MTLSDALHTLSIGRGDDLAIAFAPTLTPRRAAAFARRIARHLDDAGVPADRRVWIIAAAADDEQTARLASAIADPAAGSPLTLHDPRDPDVLVFQRRIPGQRRGGVYLNHAWQAASRRIACGDPLDLLDGLSAWFNPPAHLRPEDLDAFLVR
ncbi:MAG: hypothetical protein OXS30_11910 [Chloroflexota bacterium]|nr:hypothetical protein [Chloroflexota bacterium]